MSDLDTFYELLDLLSSRIGGPRCLADCNGSMGWPGRGVYFFFEPGQTRSNGVPRVVRVGTHALTNGSKSSLWGRLAQHRGTPGGSMPGGGNHRGSIFRLHVGMALLARDGDPSGVMTSWSQKPSASRAIRMSEYAHERLVSRYIGSMPFLWVGVDDPPSPSSDRGIIERGAIGLLSASNQIGAEPVHQQWLGTFSNRDAIRRSGLWNVNHIDEPSKVAFLSVLEHHVAK